MTKHPRTLESAGLLSSTRDGRGQVWQTRPKRVADAQRYLELISAEYDEAIGRRRSFVEEHVRGGARS